MRQIVLSPPREFVVLLISGGGGGGGCVGGDTWCSGKYAVRNAITAQMIIRYRVHKFATTVTEHRGGCVHALREHRGGGIEG